MKTHSVLLQIKGAVMAFTAAGFLMTGHAQNPVPAGTVDFPAASFISLQLSEGKWLITDPSAVPDPTGGAPEGQAYLYDSQGGLLKTLDNPNPALGRGFGSAATLIGTNLIAIGAPSVQFGFPADWIAGGIYLFDLEGTLIGTIENPLPNGPASPGSLGSLIAPFGADKLLASTSDTMVPNQVYLLGTNGQHLATFQGGDFNAVLALGAIGTSQILINWWSDWFGAQDLGVFDATGTPLPGFVGPNGPASVGLPLASLEPDRVVLKDAANPWLPEAALVFNATNRDFILTIRNPDPGSPFPVGMLPLSGGRLLLTSWLGAYVFDGEGNLLGGLVEPGAGGPVVPMSNDRYAIQGSAGPGTTSLSLYSVPASEPTQPVVLRQPVDRTDQPGTQASLTVLAAGSPPLTYIWLKNGAPVSEDGRVYGTHGSTLTLEDVTGGDQGAYSVVVSNPVGSVTSLVAKLTVPDPVIVDRFLPRAVPLGGTLVIRVEVAGTQPLTYIWSKDGTQIAVGTESTLTVSNVQLADAGLYSVSVTNNFGRATSEEWRVIVTAAFADDLDPQTRPPGPPSSLPGPVDALAVQRDGKILVGGNFISLGGMAKMFLGRLNAAGAVDAGFSPSVPGPVDWIGLRSDGRFTVADASFYPRLYQFLPSGATDPTFKDPGVSSPTRRVMLPDGRIVLLLNTPPNPLLWRLEPDGAVDPSFEAYFDPPFAAEVKNLALQRDGKILVAGNFEAVNGQPRAGLARLNPDGTLDTAFNPTQNWVSGGWVDMVAVQPDGKILVTGIFDEMGGKPSEGIARLNPDGTADGGFTASLVLGPGNFVNSIALQADGKIILGGLFDSLNNEPISHLGRLNPDGSIDRSFAPMPDGEVTALALQPNGRLLVGGNFRELAGAARSGLGRLVNTDSATQSLTREGATIMWSRGGTSPEFWTVVFEASLDGSTWIPLGPATPVVGGWQVTPLSLPANATIRARGYVACGKFNGSSWIAEAVIGMPMIVTQPASRTNTAGTTATFSVEVTGEEPFSFRWHKDGSNLSDVGKVTGATSATLTLANVLGADAGDYTVVVANSSGSLTSVVARLTVRDPWVNSSMYTPWAIQNMPDPFNRVTVGVSPVGTTPFTIQWRRNGQIIPGATAASLVISNAQYSDSGKYEAIISNTYGSLTWSPVYVTVVPSRPEPALNPGAQGSGATVFTTAVQPDGRLIVAGSFDRLSGVNCRNLGRLNANGSFDTSFGLGSATQPDGAVRALAIQPDGKILVGGQFLRLGAAVSPPPPAMLGRLNPNGLPDPSFDARFGATFFPGFVSSVSALGLQPDGKIIAGGNFTNVAGQLRAGLARLNPDGSLDSSFSANAGTGNYLTEQVQAIVVQPDGKILVGGRFSNFAGAVRQNIARLNPDGTLDMGFNPGAEGVSNLPIINTMALQSDGRILVGGLFTMLAGQPRTNLARLNPDGTLDPSFSQNIMPVNRPVRRLALQADGRIFVGGRFQNWDGAIRRFGRLNADGTPDTTFLNDVTYPNLVDQGEDVYTLTLQNDGRLVVGGRFTKLSGQEFNVNNLGRLPAVATPTDQLVYGGGKIAWLRGGTSPEVWRATFESSSDGAAWTLLGQGVRRAGGWELGGLSLSKGTLVRGRGWVVGGGASEWLVQTEAVVPNFPPVADASATKGLIISPDGKNATVILDGSRSSDPDSDPLHYRWFDAGSLLGEGVVAVTVLRVGIHPIQLAVTDGELAATNNITVEILTASQGVERLQAAVRDGVARPNPLLATLSAAIASIDRGNTVAAVNQLLAFQRKVQAQVAPLDPALASSLNQSAQGVIDALRTGQMETTAGATAKFNHVQLQPDGKVRLEFPAEAAAIYLIEASADMLHWETIGVATRQNNEVMAFEDRPDPKQPRRFYRVIKRQQTLPLDNDR